MVKVLSGKCVKACESRKSLRDGQLLYSRRERAVLSSSASDEGRDLKAQVIALHHVMTLPPPLMPSNGHLFCICRQRAVLGRATSDEGGDIQGSAARPSFENLAAAFAGEAAARLLPASYHGHDDMVAQLLSGGANVYYADAEGQTALHEAAHEVPLPNKHTRQHEHANG